MATSRRTRRVALIARTTEVPRMSARVSFWTSFMAGPKPTAPARPPLPAAPAPKKRERRRHGPSPRRRLAYLLLRSVTAVGHHTAGAHAASAHRGRSRPRRGGHHG